MALKHKPTVLIILDGFGIGPATETNAIWAAKTPYLDKMIKHCPTMLVEAAGLNVGLPRGEVGNSEVGHMSIGSGMLIYQNLPKIDRSIEIGEFAKHQILIKTADRVKTKKSKLHIMGLLGVGGIHSHIRHLKALIDFCKENNLKEVYLHLFLDGRDTEKAIGKDFLDEIIDYCKKAGVGEIASLCGRKIAMDRNNNWKNTEVAYNAIAKGIAKKMHKNPVKAVEESYKNQVFIKKDKTPVTTVSSSDSVIFFNFRSDRARQITKAFIEADFKKFNREFLNGLEFVTMTEYEKGLPVKTLFPPQIVKNPIAKVISDSGFKQLHVAETEKYAHVTFFINGLQEEKFPGEERILVPSPAVSRYDEKPEMSSKEVTDEVVKSIKSGKHEFIFINYANPDMIGHTGNVKASIKAIECIDKCLSRVVNTAVNYGGIVFVIGDHGNVEELVKLSTGKADKEHSIYPVPFIAVSKALVGNPLQEVINKDLSLFSPVGLLSDVAPTILKTIGLPLATEMTGTNLLENIKA
ncbi:2,3-bisphosphoglycerate-independent phosphoglycerate mutase [Patescibacteria group bacterium]